MFTPYVTDSEKWEAIPCEAEKPLSFIGKSVLLKNSKGLFLGGRKEAQANLVLVSVAS